MANQTPALAAPAAAPVKPSWIDEEAKLRQELWEGFLVDRQEETEEDRQARVSPARRGRPRGRR